MPILTFDLLKFREREIPGVFELDMFHAADQRGSFTKTFHNDAFELQGLENNFRESFFSQNKKNVIRGMHFQSPPYDHAKLVYCTSGTILDVILDLRKNSHTFGKSVAIEISSNNHKGLYMPRGVAHGFACLTEATMVYLTTTVHNPEADRGVRWDSFGFEWPVTKAIMSERDQAFPTFEELNSPF